MIQQSRTDVQSPPDTTLLDGSLGYSLRRAQLSTYAEFNRFMEKYGLRPSQFAVLVLIRKNPGMRQSEVAKTLTIQKANLVGLIHELQTRGLVARQPVPTDRRVSALHLTRAGELLMRKAEASHANLEAKLRSRLGESCSNQLLAVLHAFTNAGS